MNKVLSASTPWSQFSAMSLLVAAPVAIVYLALQKYIIGGLTLGTVSAGTLNATSTGGAITAGQTTVTGTTTVNAGASAITMTNAANNFTGAVNLTGGTTQITDANALTLSTLATGNLTVTSTGPLNLGQGTTGALTATSNNGAITQAAVPSSLVVAGPANLQAGTGSIILTNPNNDFQGTVTAAGTGGVSITDINSLQPLLVNAGPGVVLLTAGALVGPGTIIGGTGGTQSSPKSSLSSTASVTGANILVTFGSPLLMTGAATNWNFQLGSTANPFQVTSSSINVSIAGAVQVASVSSLTQSFAVSAAQASASAAAAQEAANTFGTDSVAEQIEFGFAGDVGTLPPMDHRLQGVGIRVPSCFNESREGEACN